VAIVAAGAGQAGGGAHAQPSQLPLAQWCIGARITMIEPLFGRRGHVGRPDLLPNRDAAHDQILGPPKFDCTSAPIVYLPASPGTTRLAVPMPPFQPKQLVRCQPLQLLRPPARALPFDGRPYMLGVDVAPWMSFR